MNSIHAIFENGVFRPVGHVDLPNLCEVEFEPRVVTCGTPPGVVDPIGSILAERYASGECDVAARHDEHQP